MTEQLNNLQQALRAAANEEGSTPPTPGADIAATAAAPRERIAEIQQRPADEMTRLLATGNRLLRVQQHRLVTAQADYEKARVERINHYRSEMQRLADDCEYELHSLAIQHDEMLGQINSMIAKLKAMRGA